MNRSWCQRRGSFAAALGGLTLSEEAPKGGSLFGRHVEQGVAIDLIARQHSKPGIRLGPNLRVLFAFGAPLEWVEDCARSQLDCRLIVDKNQ